MKSYDLFVLGAGSGGLAASKRAAKHGARVGIAETDLVGGTCVIRGCVPKKLLVYGSSFRKQLQLAQDYGWKVEHQGVDWPLLMDKVHHEVMRLSGLHTQWLKDHGVDVHQGHATFVSPHKVRVGDEEIEAERFYIAVGGRAVKPNIPGAEFGITSKEFFTLKTQPRRAVVIGGGYIGVELAGVLNGLGTEVQLVIRGQNILRGFDQDVALEVENGIKDSGIELLAEHTPVKIVRQSDASLQISLLEKGASEGKERVIETDLILFATGRKPWLEGLDLEKAGVDTINGAIRVNNDFTTSQKHIFALGDCTDRVNLTPVAIAEGRALSDTLYGRLPRGISHEDIPTAVFSQPEAATVGLPEHEARKRFPESIEIHKARFKGMLFSFSEKKEMVFVKLVVESHTRKVLGAHMVGKDAAELIQGIAVAITMGATKEDFDRTMGIHPSSGEEFVTL